MTRAFVEEPAFSFWSRPPMVVDASLIAAIVFDEPGQEEAVQALRGRQAVAPGLLRYEMANIGVKKLRRGELSLEETLASLHALAAFDIEYGEIDPVAVLRLAQGYRLTAYDASYLWLAGELKSPIGTLDQELATAARHYLNRPEA
jgi:predicted nucleic acid-binding protein